MDMPSPLFVTRKNLEANRFVRVRTLRAMRDRATNVLAHADAKDW